MSALSLDEAKEHLNITGDANDAELAAVIDAAEAAISVRVGPLEEQEVTARVRGAAGRIVLPIAPVVSVTSIADLAATAVDVDDLYLNTEAGTLEYADGLTWFGASSYAVTYTAGRDEVPQDLLYAVKEMVRHLWKTQRGGATRPGSTDSAPPAGYLIPNAVAELLEPHMQFSVA